MARLSISDALKTFDQRFAGVRLPKETIDEFIPIASSYYDNVKQAIRADENEEYFKSLVNRFLEDAFYPQNRYTINTHSNIDSAIMQGEQLLALIETKRPANVNEMVTENNINRKALWEIVYYYLASTRDTTGRKVQRIRSVEIRRLIITDSRHWLLIDANDLEKICDDYLEKHYYKYATNKLIYKNDLRKFYADISSYFSEINVNQKLKYVFFDIDLLVNNRTGFQQLYKLLCSSFLLKEGHSANLRPEELNSKFYRELLYIMGLEEKKRKGNAFITINNAVKNTFAQQLYHKYTIDKEIDPEAAEEKTFELIIIWLNRLLFIKLFESQLLLFNGKKDEYRLLDHNKIDNLDGLQHLFFDVLGKAKREDNEFYSKFSEIPYLNSSLFERQKIEKDDYNISDLKNDDVVLMPKSILGIKKESMPLIQYLIDFLNRYTFATQRDNEGATEIINANVLGLIFEKINGYKDGAVYTPSEITEYMSKNAIEKSVVRRVNQGMNWTCESIEDIRFNISNITTAKAVNNIINTTRICDPAVGSGHFLVSALNRIIAIKAELGVLFKFGKDRRLDEVDIFVEHDTLKIVDAQGEDFHYDKTNVRSQEIQETLFNEKRVIIENCLFGVDVNPKAVHICRLRLWVELLKCAYYKNNVMQTLPNIDINIKTGNSLISRIDFKAGRKKSVDKKTTASFRRQLNEYRTAVKSYRSEADKKNKQALETTISLLKDALFNTQLGFFDPEVNTNFTIFQNAFEWAFEFPELINDDGSFAGFDVIIENPPYGLINKRQNKSVSIAVESAQADYYKRAAQYQSAHGGPINIFKLFICRTHQLLKPDGIASMIFPLAFTCDQSCTEIRKFLFNAAEINDIEAFPERDNENRRVFESAKVSVCIVEFSKGTRTKARHDIAYRINNERFVDEDIPASMITLQMIKEIDEDGLSIPLATQKELELMRKVRKGSKRCEEIAKCYTGEVDITFGKKFISYDETDTAMVRGAQVQKYRIVDDISQGEIMYLRKDAYLQENKGEKSNHHKSRRIVLQGITGVNEKQRLKMAVIDRGVFCANSVNYLMPPERDNEFEYLLAVLNSSLINWFFAKSSTNSNVNGYEVDNLPIRSASNEQKKEIALVVDQILSGAVSLNTGMEEIDNMIFTIYGLSSEEIEMVKKNQ